MAKDGCMEPNRTCLFCQSTPPILFLPYAAKNWVDRLLYPDWFIHSDNGPMFMDLPASERCLFAFVRRKFNPYVFFIVFCKHRNGQRASTGGWSSFTYDQFWGNFVYYDDG